MSKADEKAEQKQADKLEAEQNAKEARPLKVGEPVNTPDGKGKVTSVTDSEIHVDLDNKTKAIYKPSVVSAA